MMTEDEAKQKWCPFARVVGQDMNGEREYEGNRVYLAPDDTSLDDILGHFSAKCAGSGCMAWRWHSSDDVDGDPRSDPDARLAPGTGYCGLAGRPA